MKGLLASLTLIAIVSVASLSEAANPVPFVDDYDGWVSLKTPQGHPVDYYWYIVFDGYGHVALNASGAPIFGSYYDIGSHRVVVLYNQPYSSVFAYHLEGPRMVLDWFTDSHGNRLHSSWMWTFEN